MRIQHNIMAMNAYRNYTSNVSAMQKNLEKLSSGYKINRAGDDAAGLAISEKMRAQITGLETAQKNAKDGISLVQTAEGALTEVHDMLNRMVELATQSANGTYDNSVDRAQMQKELNQLRSEIDRIADSSNFNGIKLLDGSMDGAVTAGGAVKDMTNYTEFTLPNVVANTSEVGTGTIIHEASSSVAKTEFQVDFGNAAYKIDATDGENLKMTLTAGENTVSIEIDKAKVVDVATAAGLTVEDGDVLDAEDIAKVFAEAVSTDVADAVTFTGAEKGDADGELKIGEGEDAVVFTVAADSTNTNQLTFTQKTAPTTDEQVIEGKWNVLLEGVGGALVDSTTTTTIGVEGDATELAKFGITAIDLTGLEVEDGTTVTAAYDGQDTGALTVTIDGTNYEITFVDGQDAAEIAGQTITLTEDGGDATITITMDENADNVKVGYDKYDEDAATYTISEATVGTSKTTTTTSSGAVGVSGKADYNASTEVITQGKLASSGRLASTYVQDTAFNGKIKDGAALKVGNKTYVFAVGSDSEVAASSGNIVKVDLTNYTGGETDFHKIALTQLTKDAQANGNDMFSIGYDDGKLTFTEQETYQTTAGDDAVDLSSKEAISKQFGFSADGMVKASSLTLQIGDTADSFNQLKVDIKDMHVKSMGDGTTSIGDISIATQEDAARAVDVIKKAINYVSDVRGDLGATQNRLDHTINNLSVMTENIQDAESTIRDVDIAEEMMAYTKNNILIQSAQAMLAQANQVPQGVLQLLG